jgi:hypothetical protein
VKSAKRGVSVVAGALDGIFLDLQRTSGDRERAA